MVRMDGVLETPYRHLVDHRDYYRTDHLYRTTFCTLVSGLSGRLMSILVLMPMLMIMLMLGGIMYYFWLSHSVQDTAQDRCGPDRTGPNQSGNMMLRISRNLRARVGAASLLTASFAAVKRKKKTIQRYKTWTLQRAAILD